MTKISGKNSEILFLSFHFHKMKIPETMVYTISLKKQKWPNLFFSVQYYKIMHLERKTYLTMPTQTIIYIPNLIENL